MMAACEAQARATSSRASTYPTASPPAPPKASGMATPIRPSSPMRRTVSAGKRASRSMASAMGRTLFSANSRAIACTILCSSVSSMSTPVPSPPPPATVGRRLLFQELLELRGEQRDDLEQVAHDPIVRDLEDGRLGVLVHGHDHLGGPHAGQVLDGPGDAEAEVELGRDGATGLADLEAVRSPPSVHRRPRGAHRRPQHPAEVLEDHEV